MIKSVEETYVEAFKNDLNDELKRRNIDLKPKEPDKEYEALKSIAENIKNMSIINKKEGNENGNDKK